MTDNRHVVVITQALSGGGAEQVCREWVDLLRKHGMSVTVVSLRVRHPVDLGDGVAVVELPSSHLSRVRELRKLLATSRPHVAVSLLSYVNILLLVASWRMPVRVVISEHNVPDILLRRQGFSQKLQLAAARRLYGMADHVIAVSHAVATDLRVNFHLTGPSLSVVPNIVAGVSGGDFSTSVSKLGDPRKITLVVPARLTAQKRPLQAVRIAEAVANRGHDVELFFVGDRSPSFPEDVELTSSLVDLRELGWDDSWAQMFREGAIVLLPSEIEGFGNVLVEAARGGLASVASSWALGVGDALWDGLTGRLAANDTPESFADAILSASDIDVGANDLSSYLYRFSSAGAWPSLSRALNVDA